MRSTHVGIAWCVAATHVVMQPDASNATGRRTFQTLKLVSGGVPHVLLGLQATHPPKQSPCSCRCKLRLYASINKPGMINTWQGTQPHAKGANTMLCVQG